jgi:hypothetical protein
MKHLFKDQISFKILEEINHQINNKICNQVWNKVRNPICDQFEDKIWHLVERQVFEND